MHPFARPPRIRSSVGTVIRHAVTVTRYRRCMMILLLWTPLISSAVAQPSQAERWKTPYTAEDASGDHVLGLWKFNTDNPTADSGPLQHNGRLDGAVPVATGRFDGGLESFPGWPIEDKHHALVVSHHAALSPSEAFTAEMWIKPKPEISEAAGIYLLDKKYASHHGYQWRLGAADGSGARQMNVNLGFGTDSDSWFSDRLTFAPDQWTHVAFSYDGTGTVRFFRDGSSVGTMTIPGRMAVSPGDLPLCLGDRIGSNYGGFPGYLDEVRLCRGTLEFNPASVSLESDRTVWLRRESASPIAVTVHNLQDIPLEGASLSLLGTGDQRQPRDLPTIPPGQSHTQHLTFDTSLRPDTYNIRAQVSVPGPPAITCGDSLLLQIVARPLPHRMPVLMWGIGSPQGFKRERERLLQLGFTHCLGFGADYGSIKAAGKPVPPASPTVMAANRRMFDQALAHNMRITASLHPGYYLKKIPELARVNRDGVPYSRQDCNAALPGLQEFCENVGASVVQAYGDHPAFDSALVNSEVRDGSQPSFSEFDHAAYRDFASTEIPQEIEIKNGVQWTALPDFPDDRIIADDHPILKYYRWFWTVGDGWNGLHTALHRGLKSTGRKDLWTFFDPTIRAASVPGSGGEVDVLSQWTYTQASPLRVGFFLDEVFGMARATAHHPRVMKMTQLFWYRSSSAPIRTGKDYIASPFDDHDPDAAYISIAPMHLRGSFWSKIARPISGLMYHGWSSLVPTDGTHAYKYTQPDLQTEFSRLHTEVLPPLAPTLLQVPDRPSDVAWLNSFTSQMFARRGTYGYSHDESYLTLLHTQLQPEVIFEDTLLNDGLDQYRILVLVDCDVLTQSVADRILEFQQRGGLIIGDPNLAPAIRADITIPRYRRTKQTEEDKRVILSNANALAQQLAKSYSRYASCSNPELVTRVRSVGESDYVFLVNDQREYGTYVGQHGLVMEHGLASEGKVSVQRSGVVVYDLIRHQLVPADSNQEATQWSVRVGACDGALFLLTPRAIQSVTIETPPAVTRGQSASVQIRVTDSYQQSIPAVVPVHVTITDPNGRVAERSGHYGAADGTLQLDLEPAANDVPGVWQIEAQEGASNRIGFASIRVE